MRTLQANLGKVIPQNGPASALAWRAVGNVRPTQGRCVAQPTTVYHAWTKDEAVPAFGPEPVLVAPSCCVERDLEISST
jgi:hypothetical protein